MDRYEARDAIVADLEAEGYLIKVEDYNHNVGTCYRCGTTVEPLTSPQWFVNPYLDLTDLRPTVADAALAEIFQVPVGTPLLNMDEVDFDIDGKPVFCSNEYFADGIFQLTVMRKKL